MTQVPKRGGEHPIFGVYVGGDPLTSNYQLMSPDSYSSTSQFRSEKGFQVAESALHSQKKTHNVVEVQWKIRFH